MRPPCFGIVSVLQRSRSARVPACTAIAGYHPAEFVVSHPPSWQKPLRTCPLAMRLYCLFRWWPACPYWPYYQIINDWFVPNLIVFYEWGFLFLCMWAFGHWNIRKIQNYHSLSVGSFQLKGETQFEPAWIWSKTYLDHIARKSRFNTILRIDLSSYVIKKSDVLHVQRKPQFHPEAAGFRGVTARLPITAI